MDLKELLYRCKRIRAIEEGIADRYGEQEMRCPTHLSIGQELVGAAAGMVLRKDDLAVSTHRAHAHYLGKGGCAKAMLAEIYGKKTGCAKGRGGSMHLIDLSVGFVGSTAIVGNTVPVGVGLGLSIQLDGDDRIACVFIGDAVFETGALYESMNFAATRKLPVLFLCENNLYSVYSPLSVRQPAGRKNYEVARVMGLHATHADGTSATEAYKAIKNIVAHVREERTPALLEVDTYRWREHCGPNFDNDIGYRSEEEYEAWKAKDAQNKLEDNLLTDGTLTPADIESMDAKITSEVEVAFAFAKSSPFPAAETAGDFEYAE